jgi:SAM-dependent methyltransferase
MAQDIVAAIRQIAEELLARLRAVEAALSASGAEEPQYREVKSALDQCVSQLDAFGLRGPDNRLPSSELWNVAGDVLQRGWLQNQARTKPRGYAGDYDMLARIYENRLCDDPLGRLMDRYFQEEAAPRAVRNRMKMMEDWIVELAASRGLEGKKAKVAIVGSAFGLEVRDALKRLDEQARQSLRVTLLDLDWAAIEFARGQLEELLRPEQLNAVSANLFRLPDRPQVASHLAGSDLLLCPGLFDYLDDAAAQAMLRAFWERLAPGGRLAIFQFAPHNPTRSYMEWLGNWYLIYRTPAELEQLAHAAGLPRESWQLGSEPLGVDLLLSLTVSNPR